MICEWTSFVVRPIPGTLVLFPSYFRKGTIRLLSPRHDLTIALDAVPER
jgi:hypothetical protein